MRLLVACLFVFAFQFHGKCDTIANWQVYYNGDLLRAFNATQSKLSVVLPTENRNETDLIAVEYFTDMYCEDCMHLLIILEPESGKQWSHMVDVIELKELLATNKSRFLVYRLDMFGERNEKTFLFELTI